MTTESSRRPPRDHRWRGSVRAQVLALAIRELRERRALLGVAAVFGLLAALLPWFAAPDERESMQFTSAQFVLMVFGLAVAAHTGATVLASDLKTGCFRFYLAQPVPALALWLGKLLGGAAVVAATVALLLLPFALTGLASLAASEERRVFLATLIALPFVYLVSAWLGIAFGSRSRWIVVDLVLVPLVGLGSLATVLHLGLRWETMAAVVVGTMLVAAWMVAIALASARAISRGGSDIRMAHAAGSICLLAVVAIAWLLGATYARWLLAPGIDDLAWLGLVQPAPRGDWLEVCGQARHRQAPACFLFHPETDRVLSHRNGMDLAYFAGDGGSVVWNEAALAVRRVGSSWNPRLREWYRVRLDAPGRLQPIRLGVVEGSAPGDEEFCLPGASPSGLRVACSRRDELVVYDLRERRELFSAPLHCRTDLPAFRSEDLLRVRVMSLWPWPRDGGRIVEIDLRTGRTTETGWIDPRIGWRRALSADGERLILSGDALPPHLLDARTGQLIGVLETVPGWSDDLRTQFLGDGRPVVAEVTGRRARLHVFACDGKPERVIELGPSVGVVLGGEVLPGRLAVGLTGRWNWYGWGDVERPPTRVRLVDVDTGETGPRLPGLCPAVNWSWLGGLPPPAGSLGARLFTTADNELVELDPATGALRRILPRGTRGATVGGWMP